MKAEINTLTQTNVNPQIRDSILENKARMLTSFMTWSAEKYLNHENLVRNISILTFYVRANMTCQEKIASRTLRRKHNGQSGLETKDQWLKA